MIHSQRVALFFPLVVVDLVAVDLVVDLVVLRGDFVDALAESNSIAVDSVIFSTDSPSGRLALVFPCLM
jgi:hypothetical protein